MDKVMITGVNHGLGLALTKVFLSANYQVYAGYYQKGPTEELFDLKNDNLHLFQLDISDITSVKSAFDEVTKLTDSLDIIINNAGIICKDEIDGKKMDIYQPLDFDSIKHVIDVNALGMLRVSNVFIPLLDNGERKLLVNISSEAGSISDSFRNEWFGYCMSKAALNMASTIIHNEFKKHDGQVLLIHPGYLQTYMSGQKNINATYSADFGATHIYEVIMNSHKLDREKAVFLDLFNKEMRW